MNAIMNPGELRRLLEDPRKPVIIDARSPGDHAEGHVPGAINVVTSDLVPEDTTMPGLYQVNEAIDQRFRVLGRFEKVEIVVCGHATDPDACRALWIMHYAGHLAARLLDGGMNAWRAEDAPLTTEATPIDPAPFAVRGRRELIARIDEIEPALADAATVVLDVRSPDEHAAGHLEGAIHIPHQRFLDADGARFADLEALRPELEALGLERRTPILVYSDESRRSALVAVALRHLGHRKVKNFLGGWHEWSRKAPPPA